MWGFPTYQTGRSVTLRNAMPCIRSKNTRSISPLLFFLAPKGGGGGGGERESFRFFALARRDRFMPKGGGWGREFAPLCHIPTYLPSVLFRVGLNWDNGESILKKKLGSVCG